MIGASPLDWILVYLNGSYFFYIVVMGAFLFRKRAGAVRQKTMSGHYFKVYQGEIPTDVKAFENHFNNQFQMPLYFMATCLFSIVTKSTSLTVVVLATVFVASRLAHSWIHLTSNNILRRAAFYFTGVVAVAAMWIFILVAGI